MGAFCDTGIVASVCWPEHCVPVRVWTAAADSSKPAQRGYEIVDEAIIHSPFDVSSGREPPDELLRSRPRITAIFAITTSQPSMPFALLSHIDLEQAPMSPSSAITTLQLPHGCRSR